MADRDSFGTREDRLAALSLRIDLASRAHGQSVDAWAKQRAWLDRNLFMLGSWITSLHDYRQRSDVKRVTTETTRFMWWARTVRCLHPRVVRLRFECRWLEVRVWKKAIWRRVSDRLTLEFFLITASILLTLWLLVVIFFLS